jgi:hypothetical protein
LALGPLGLALECGSQDISVVTLHPSDAGGLSCHIEADGGVGASADGGAACPSGQFCQTTLCGDTLGTCQPRGERSECTGPASFVCGCDGISYFNDCLRQAAGVPASTQGGCFLSLTTALCLDSACPKESGAPCALIVPPPLVDLVCAPQLTTCWILPLTPPANEPTNFRRLVPLAGQPCSPDLTCVDAFTAIQTGGAYEQATDCP